MLHGGAQNAHTFDTVAIALQRSLLAIDLPHHGHSDAGPQGPGDISQHADDVAVALSQWLTRARPLVGMSMGGLTALLVAGRHPELVSALMLIDVTPSINADKARHITDFVNGPASFPDFNALLQRTAEHNPTRSESSLRRGILHNAVQQDDGTWVWRHQRFPRPDAAPARPEGLWDVLEALPQPVVLVRGMARGSVVDDDDERELRRRRPDATVVHVEGAGHSVQGDRPLDLAIAIHETLFAQR
jgi:pimeloyl-ACP methyl ester carboxylesterase